MITTSNSRRNQQPVTTTSASPTIKKFSTAYQSEHYTLLWWSCLTRIATLNIFLWVWTYASCSSAQLQDDFHKQAHLYLSGIYVSVCAYRSVYPRIDLERYCLFDHGTISSIFLGRAAATIAEIAYSCQFALLLHKLGTIHGHTNMKMLSYIIMPCITVAQVCCWCGVVTINHIWHAIEESIWALISAIIGGCFASILIYGTDKIEIYYLSWFGCVASVAYFYFMVTVDVPMYYKRYKASKSKEQRINSVTKGLKDAWSRRVVTKNWNHVWKEEAAWLTGYFSLAVWMSIAMVHLSLT